MLILQRKTAQSLMIGDDIKITVVEIGSDKVKIAIEAPKDIPILRSELLDAAASNYEAIAPSEKNLSLLKGFIKKQSETK